MPSSVSTKMIVLMAACRVPYHMVTGSYLPCVDRGTHTSTVLTSVIFISPLAHAAPVATQLVAVDLNEYSSAERRQNRRRTVFPIIASRS